MVGVCRWSILCVGWMTCPMQSIVSAKTRQFLSLRIAPASLESEYVANMFNMFLRGLWKYNDGVKVEKRKLSFDS